MTKRSVHLKIKQVMENQIIQDYGTTVSPEEYINALQGHQYIPQADQCILNVVKNHVNENAEAKIIDLGCGPGRLSLRLAQSTKGIVVGADISESFINYAISSIVELKEPIINKRVLFACVDFVAEIPNRNSLEQTWNIFTWHGAIDCIVMQGVMHHIHGEDRAKFLKKSFDLLKPGGILVIGDEFIKEYDYEDARIFNVINFYLHIIDEARKGGFDELAKKEAKNLIDDCFPGTNFSDHATEKTFEHIYQCAQTINQIFYSHGSVALSNNDEAHNKRLSMFTAMKHSDEHLVDLSTKNFNRGTYKISPNVFIKELSLYGFVLEKKYEIGPVKQLGGMGVLVFKKV